MKIVDMYEACHEAIFSAVPDMSQYVHVQQNVLLGRCSTSMLAARLNFTLAVNTSWR